MVEEARMVQGTTIEVVMEILGKCAKDQILRGRQTVADQGLELIDQSVAAFTYLRKTKDSQGKTKDHSNMNNQDNLMVAGQQTGQ